MKLSTHISSNNSFSVKDYIKSISYSLEVFGTYLTSLHGTYDYNTIISSISNAVDELGNAVINAGCNEDYVKAYKKWGRFGWSFNVSINKKFFLSAPDSLQEADTLMQQYCNDEEIFRIMEELKSADINQKDLEEAYFTYTNHKYKSSVMLLFSLLDQQLINRNFFNEEGHLKTGAGVIGELKKSKKVHRENTHLHYLQFTLIIYCLIALFQSNKNFEKEPSIINRNFLIHGMSKNDINKTDCMKVWSALYSLVVVYPKLEKEIQQPT